jgi:RND family efflux transporter MFP subunit
MRSIIKNTLLSVGTLAVTIVIAKQIVSQKPEAQKVAPVELGVPVEIARFEPSVQNAIITAQGVVEPAHTVSLSAQVGGVVTRVHPQMVVGGFVKRGASLAQIDPSDYQLAVREAEARVQIATQEVQLEAGRREVALKEWKVMRRRLKGKIDEVTKERATREPQRRVSEANLRIAKSALRRARLNLARATLKAPFDAVVLSESVEKGQLVGPGAPVAQLVSTESFWVKASVPSSELAWVSLPSKEGERGSPVKVRYDMGERVVEREGFVARRLSQLEAVGRMAQLIIEVPNPLEEGDSEEARHPLLLGAQVRLEIQGKPLDDVIELPRNALRSGDKLWVFSPEARASLKEPSLLNASDAAGPAGSPTARTGRLTIKPVKVLRRRLDTVLISARERSDEGVAPLSAQDEVVTSRLSTPVPQMLLRSVR